MHEKILLVIDHYRDPHAGTESQLMRLVNGLIGARYETHLLVFTASDYIKAGHFPCGVTVLGYVSLSSPAMWKALWFQAKSFRAQGFRLAHVFFNDPSLICPPVFALNGIRTIISRRDMGYWYTPLHKWWLRCNRLFVAGAVVNCHAVSSVTRATEWLPSRRVHVIYNGFDSSASQLQGVPADIADWVQGGSVIAVIVANLRPIKRIHDAVQAVSLLEERLPSLRLLVIGSGDDTVLQTLASELGVSERVRFLGARPQPMDYVRHCHIGVLCSASEGLSNAIIEYLHCGLPVVCSRVGGNPELVTHGETGFCHDVGNVNALAAHLEQLALQPQLRALMGARATTCIAERFNEALMLRQHVDLYRSLMAVA